MYNDVCRPFSNESYRGPKYFLMVIDDFLHVTWVFCLKQKLDTSITLCTLFNHVKNQLGKLIKQILVAPVLNLSALK
jgi:hypothetical protein